MTPYVQPQLPWPYCYCGFPAVELRSKKYLSEGQIFFKCPRTGSKCGLWLWLHQYYRENGFGIDGRPVPPGEVGHTPLLPRGGSLANGPPLQDAIRTVIRYLPNQALFALLDADHPEHGVRALTDFSSSAGYDGSHAASSASIMQPVGQSRGSGTSSLSGNGGSQAVMPILSTGPMEGVRPSAALPAVSCGTSVASPSTGGPPSTTGLPPSVPLVTSSQNSALAGPSLLNTLASAPASRKRSAAWEDGPRSVRTKREEASPEPLSKRGPGVKREDASSQLTLPFSVKGKGKQVDTSASRVKTEPIVYVLDDDDASSEGSDDVLNTASRSGSLSTTDGGDADSASSRVGGRTVANGIDLDRADGQFISTVAALPEVFAHMRADKELLTRVIAEKEMVIAQKDRVIAEKDRIIQTLQSDLDTLHAKWRTG